MTTRSGASYKRTALANQYEGESRAVVVVSPETGTAGLSDLVRMLLEDRRRRDEELVEETGDQSEMARNQDAGTDGDDQETGGGHATARGGDQDVDGS